MLNRAGDRNRPLRNLAQIGSFPRYDEVNEEEVGYRSNARNFRNFFRGCALFGMFIGLVSFFFGFSSTFDDFFVLCQLIFVHVFINGLYNPLTIKIPLEGFSLVQFMAWLPIEARRSI